MRELFTAGRRVAIATVTLAVDNSLARSSPYLRVAKKLSHMALSKQSPTVPIEGRIVRHFDGMLSFELGIDGVALAVAMKWLTIP